MKFYDIFTEIIFPWPILSLETGRPEVFSFDIGLETLFIPVTNEAHAGVGLGLMPKNHETLQKLTIVKQKVI